MSRNREYPRLGRVRRLDDSRSICEACPDPASHALIVEYTFMRGDDEVFKACDYHQTVAQNNLSGFLRACESKLKQAEARA